MKKTAEIYETSPQLICVDNSDRRLLFSHFGNLKSLNVQRPTEVLEILRALKKPSDFKKLAENLPGVARRDVKRHLDALVDFNYVLKSSGDKAVRPNLFISRLTKSESAARHVAASLAETSVVITDFLNLGDRFSRQLKEIGFKKVSVFAGEKHPGEYAFKAGLHVVIGESAQALLFSKINQLMLKRRQKWLPVTLDFFGGRLGPVIGIEGGPCFDCLIERERTRPFQGFDGGSYKDLISESSVESDFSQAYMASTVLNLAAFELIKIASKIARPKTFDGVYTFDLFNFRMDFTGTPPSPVCPVCADAGP